MTKPALSFLQLDLTLPLAVVLRQEPDSPVLAREPVLPVDFADIASEAWRDGCLRAGCPDLALAQTPMCLTPILADDSDSRCAGFRVDVELPIGKSTQRVFTFRSLRPAADRAADPLVKAGVLLTHRSCVFEIVVDSRTDAPIEPSPSAVSVAVSLRSPALSYLHAPLRPLLERATPSAGLDPEEFPVFYTRAAFEKAEACARRGGQSDPPVETGGVLFGSLAACPDSGEFFAIVHEVIEVQDAEEKTFSLSYSSRSWTRLQAIQKARQAAYPDRADRLLGQAHGHSFMPNDGRVCAECEKRATCSLTSVFVSQDDQTWHRAVFARQPWALCHIFGLSARGEPVHQLFGLNDGRLRPRGYYLIPEFPFD